MTTVVSGFASAGSKTGNGNGSGTEFLSMLPPAGELLKDWNNTKTYDQQTGELIPQVFKDAMSVREEVYAQQGVPLEAEFDDDDPRSWHWVVYASVAQTSSPPPAQEMKSKPDSKAEEERRASASATRLPVGTIRLVPPPHRPNPYVQKDKHPDADPPAKVASNGGKKHPEEPYIKLGRLAILEPYRALGLSKLLITNALDYAAKNPESIRPPPSPTTLEFANQMGKAVEKAVTWNGLAMVHAQASVERLWAKYGFVEELRSEEGKVEISKEDHWIEEGIEHLGMWKRLKLDLGRL